MRFHKPSRFRFPERLLPNTRAWEQGIIDHRQRYEFASEFCIGKKVIDVACGVGYGTKLLLDRNSESVHGLDLSEDAIAIAHRLYSMPRISFSIDDCETLSSVKGKAQAIVALECIEHLRAPERFLARCAEILTKDGVLVLSTPNAAALGRPHHGKPINRFHIREYTRQELVDILGKYFREVTIYYQNKSKLLELHEDMARFVNYAYKMSPIMRLSLWLRRTLQRSGHDPIIRPFVRSYDDFTISPVADNADRAWVLLAVCRQPMNIENNINCGDEKLNLSVGK